jgi:hypothetical protein
MGDAGRTGKVKIGILVVSALLLWSCTGERPAAVDRNVGGTRMANTPDPERPDTPESGQPGQPGMQGNAGLVQGQVLAAGQPVGGALVTPQSTDQPPQAVPELAVFTDEQGRYAWTLPPGGYRLHVVKDGFAPGSELVHVERNQATVVNVTLEPQP